MNTPRTDQTIEASHKFAIGVQKARLPETAAAIVQTLLQSLRPQAEDTMDADEVGSSVGQLMRSLEAFGRAYARSNKLRGEQEGLWISGIVTRDLYAFAYPDEEDPGSYRVRGYDTRGRRMEGSAKYIDSQAEPPQGISNDLASAISEGMVDERDARDIVQDPSAPTEERIEALQEWTFLDNDAAAAFILNELETGEMPADWRNALIYAAEDARVTNEREQPRLCNRLRELALDLRQRSEPHLERVVWTAVRRFASLIPEERARDLVDFLHQKGQVDTRLVALQGVVHIFEAAPPDSLGDLQPLADRIFQLSSKLIDPDIMTAGETSAIAEKGMHALAALGDPRLEDCLSKLDSLSWQWLSRQVLDDLNELKSGWESRDPNLATHPAFLQLRKVLSDRHLSNHEQPTG